MFIHPKLNYNNVLKDVVIVFSISRNKIEKNENIYSYTANSSNGNTNKCSETQGY